MMDATANPADDASIGVPYDERLTGEAESTGNTDGLSDDFYVTLQLVSLDFIATQLDRISVKFVRQTDQITETWERFDVSISIRNDNWLSIRATFKRAYPVTALTALAGRCNWWNGGRMFVRASVTMATGRLTREDDDDEGRTIPIAKVHLDLHLPLPAGIAPVQFQALHRDLIGNISVFEEKAQLDELIPNSAWPWE